MCSNTVDKQQMDQKIGTMDKLTQNFNETTGFYKMVKCHTWISLIVAIIFLVVGFGLYVAGFISYLCFGKDLIGMSLISGSIVEVIAGTAFWLHNKSISELNEFHKRLNSTERYLTSTMLADKLPEEKRNESYIWILQNCILTDIEIQTGTMLEWRHKKN